MASQAKQQELSLEDYQKESKLKIFEIAKTYLQHTDSINPIIIYILLLLECLQILWFSIHPRLLFLNNPLMLSYFRTVLSYLNFQSAIQTQNDMLLPLVVVATILIALHVGTLALSIKSVVWVKKSEGIERFQFSSILHKVATFQIVLLNTVFIIPVFNVSVITLYCDRTSVYHSARSQGCYDTTHIVLCILSAVNILVIIIQSLFYGFIFYIRNPFSKSYYSVPANLHRLAKLLLKLLPPLYFVVDIADSFQNVYVIVFMILSLAYVAFFRINSAHSFNHSYFYFELFTESLIIWFCISSALCTQLTFSGMSFIQSCVCAVLFAAAVCTVEASLTQIFLENNLCSNVKKQDKEKFVYLLAHALLQQNNENSINTIVYIKLLNANHNTNSLELRKKISKLDIKPQELKEMARQLLLIIIDKFFEDTNSINLKLTKCLILFDNGLKILSLHGMSELRQDKLSIYEQFMIYYFKATRQIYEESEMKGNEDNMNEINTYLEFTENMNGFENELESCAKNNQQFWEELCEDIPSINKVYSLARKSVVYAGKIEEKFKKIQSIFPQNLASLFLYFQFLTHVCAKNKQFNKIRQKWNLQKQREQQKQGLDVENRNGKIKFGANDKMCVLHVSTSSSSIGIVTNCNSEVKKFLGYEKHQLLNQKVTKIMPKIYSDIHDKFITDYLEKADLMRLPTEKTVFAYKKNLRIIETCLAVKIFPSMTVGFQLVGFFKESPVRQDQMNIMVNMKTLQIEGMSEGFLKFSGNMFKLNEIQKQPLKLSNLFPEIETGYEFKAGECMQTLLRFSDCTDKLIDLDQSSEQSRRKFEKVVVLQMDYISCYRQVKIGVFSVIELEKFTSMHDANSRMSEKKVRIQKAVKHASQAKRAPAKSSTNLDQEVASIQRKVQQFISKNSRYFQICLIKIVFFVCFISLTVASVFVNIYETTFASQHAELMKQINLCNNVSILQGKILTQNYYLTELKDDQQKWQACRSQYIAYLQDLQDTATMLFQKSNSRRTVNLVINQFDLYNFKIILNNASDLQTQSLHYIDGILQAVFMGMDFSSKNFSSSSDMTDQQAVDSLYFIEENMKDTLPGLAERTTSAYGQYFQHFINKQFNNQLYFAVGKVTTFLLICVIVTVVIKNYSKFNYVLVRIYCNVLKWDAYELFSKCHKFREKSFEISNEAKQSTRHSDLVRMLPKSLIVKLSEGLINRSIDNEMMGKQIKTSIMMSKSNKSKKNGEHQQQLEITNNEQNNSMEPISNKSDLINLKFESSLTSKCLLVFILLLGLISINFVALYFKSQFNEQIMAQRDNSINLGKYRKSFLFTLFYGIQVSQGNEQYRRLYDKQLQSFYNMSQSVSKLVGDPQPYLRQIYKQIGIVNSIAMNELKSTAQSEIKQLLFEGGTKLYQMSDQIGDLTAKRSSNQFAQIESMQKTMRIIKIVLDILATLLFVRIALVCLIKAAENQLEHSCNMMKMIPIWLISKSVNILKIISAEDIVHDKKRKKMKNMEDESATNLISDSAI